MTRRNLFALIAAALLPKPKIKIAPPPLNFEFAIAKGSIANLCAVHEKLLKLQLAKVLPIDLKFAIGKGLLSEATAAQIKTLEFQMQRSHGETIGIMAERRQHELEYNRAIQTRWISSPPA